MAWIGAQTAYYEPSAPPAGYTEQPYVGGGYYGSLEPTDPAYIPTDMFSPWYWAEPEPIGGYMGGPSYLPPGPTGISDRYLSYGAVKPRPEDYVVEQAAYELALANYYESLSEEPIVEKQGPLDVAWDVVTGAPKFVYDVGAEVVGVGATGGDVLWNTLTNTLEFAGDVFTGAADFIWDTGTGAFQLVGDAAKFVMERMEIKGGYDSGQGPQIVRVSGGGTQAEQMKAEAELTAARAELIAAQTAAGYQPTYSGIEAANLADLLRNRDQPVPVYEPAKEKPDYVTYLVMALAAILILKKSKML